MNALSAPARQVFESSVFIENLSDKSEGERFGGGSNYQSNSHRPFPRYDR